MLRETLWAILGCIAVVLIVVGLLLTDRNKSYTIQCAVITPDGPVQTVNLKAKDVRVTDFGIVKSKEGIYIPTTNEICVITKESE
jgi:hypothetical protein